MEEIERGEGDNQSATDPEPRSLSCGLSPSFYASSLVLGLEMSFFNCCALSLVCIMHHRSFLYLY